MSTTFGRYVAEAPLGKGGMGVVFRGRDPILSRVVAIKVLEIANGMGAANMEEFRERFFREARSAAALSHPNIVTVYDMGMAEQGPFLVMELVEGVSLQAELDRLKRLPLERVATIGAQIAAALSCAHAAGVVHRDIKPANMLLGRDGTVKLMDFGLARVAESTLTAAGQFLGSPLFSSPEQMQGTNVGPASDIFSLGVTLWLLLTGAHPFRRATLQASIRAIVQQPAAAPSSVVVGLDPALDAVLDRALAKDPAARFASADEFRLALVAAGQSQPIVGTARAADSEPAALELVVVQGPDVGRHVGLRDQVRVGRSRGDLLLTDSTISSDHCIFAVSGGDVVLTDSASSNGCFIGEARVVGQTRISVGARVRLGLNTVVSLRSTAAHRPAVAGGAEAEALHTEGAPVGVGTPPAFVLVVEQGPRTGIQLPLAASLILSRDEGMGRLDDSKVSRQHASVMVRSGGRVYLRDLASTNGTWFGGQRVREVELQVGDRIRVGDTTLRLDRPANR